MKQLFLTILAVTITLVGFSQKIKRPGYVAKSSTYKFKEDKVGIPMKGYYILKDGTEVEAIIAYRKPEFLSGDYAAPFSLYICKELTNVAVNPFNTNDPNHKEFIKKEDLKAFFIDGHLYANIEKVGWRIVLNEGAIHDFIKVVKMTKDGKNFYVHFTQKQWFQSDPFGSALAPVSNAQRLALIGSIPSTVAKGKTPKAIIDEYKANLISIDEAEAKYNLWFDNNSEMQIDYILGADGLTQKEESAIAAVQAAKDKAAADAKANAEAERLAKEKAAAEAKAKEEEMKAIAEAIKNANHAVKQNPFRDRSTTVSASVASAKPEVKIKKESFLDRINRIKADGNKVGVVVTCSNITVNPSSHTYFSKQKKVEVAGSYEPVAGIENIGKKAVEEFNKGFSTDVFELVNMKDIPYKDDGKGGKEDDWWATKYKVIIFYDFNPYYTAMIQTSGEAPNVKEEFRAEMYVKSSASMMSPYEGETKMKSAGKAPKIGSYASKIYLGDPATKVYIIQDLKALINPWTDVQIMEHLLEGQSDFNAKFIKKELK